MLDRVEARDRLVAEVVIGRPHAVAVVDDELDGDAITLSMDPRVSRLRLGQRDNKQHYCRCPKASEKAGSPAHPCARSRSRASYRRESGCPAVARPERTQ